MPAVLATTRRHAGFNDDGTAQFYTTFHAGPPAPKTVAEWIGQRRDSLGSFATWPAAVAALALLEQLVAGDDAKAAAKAAGRTLTTPEQLYGTGQMLAELHRLARSGYAPAVPPARAAAAAWTACWGDQPPKVRTGAREGGELLPAAGTGLRKTGPWYDPARRVTG